MPTPIPLDQDAQAAVEEAPPPAQAHGNRGIIALLCIIAIAAIVGIFMVDNAKNTWRTTAMARTPKNQLARATGRVNALEHPPEVAPATHFRLPVTDAEVDALLERDCLTDVRLARQFGWKLRGLPQKPEAEAVAACVARAKAAAAPTTAAPAAQSAPLALAAPPSSAQSAPAAAPSSPALATPPEQPAPAAPTSPPDAAPASPAPPPAEPPLPSAPPLPSGPPSDS